MDTNKKTIALLKAILAEKLGCDPSSIDEQSAFFNLGVTSLISEEIRAALKNYFPGLSETVMFEYPNIRRLAAHLEGKLILATDSVSPVVSSAPDKPSEKHGYEIAIIGISGRFPQADNPGELWRNLLNNKDCVTEIPKHRWDHLQRFSTDKRNRQALFSKWGGFINGVEEFDPLFFQMSHREAESLDPQQKLFLQCCWELMEDAGYGNPENRATDNIGVYVGVTWNEFSVLALEEGVLDANYRGAGSLYWGIPNRVSYFLDLKGPSVAIDTACSSSLVAIHDACHSLLSHECEMAIAGGVNLNLHPAKYLYLSQNHFLSADGKCRSFGAGGDGYVPGEGVAAILLKPLEHALSDGDYIYGVIRGTAVNHGGKVTGYTVPNPNAQRDLVVNAIKQAQIDPEHISYIECHGTGTELGDPIEVKGLSSAFERFTEKKQFCAIGSVKSNIGHLEAAAGVAGVIKVLQSMRHRVIPGSLHSGQENQKLNLPSTAFYIAKSNLDWQPANQHDKRIASISSFGAGGSNAHLIIEEHPQPAGKHTDGEQRIIALTAQTPEQLKEYVDRFIGFITAVVDDPVLRQIYSIDDVAYTLLHGRKHFSCRLAIVADSFTVLLEKLRQFSRDGAAADGVYSGQIGAAKTADAPAVNSEENANAWAQQWVAGAVAPPAAVGRRVPLPTYPFLRERSWISARTPLAGNKAIGTGSSRLHPLVDANSSTLRQQKYRKTFHVSEYVLEDHLVNEIHVIPGVCHLEIAAVTGALAAERPVASIKDVWFSNVISVEDQRTVEIEFLPKGDVVHYQIKDPQQDILFSRGKIQYAESNAPLAAPPGRIDIAGIRASLTAAWDRQAAYELFVRTGIIQKASFQVLTEIGFNSQQCLSKLVLPQHLRADFDQYELHPALMDGAVQTAMMFVQFLSDSEVDILPFHFSQVRQFAALTEAVYVVCRLVDRANKQFDMSLCNESGETLAEITGFILKEMKHEQADGEVSSSYYSPHWEKRDATPVAVAADSLLLIGANDAWLERLKRQPGFDRARILQVVHGDEYREDGDRFVLPVDGLHDYQNLIKKLKNEKRLPGHIVICGDLSTSVANLVPDTIDAQLSTGVKSLFLLCKALMPVAREASVIYLSQAASGGYRPLEQAISGLFKTVKVEKPTINGKVVHIEGGLSDDALASILAAELRTADVETDIVYRDQQRHVRKFDKAASRRFAVSNDLPRCNGSYLITGGLGAIGLLFARHLAEHYQASVYLTGRSPLTPEKQRMLEQVPTGQGRIRYLACDVSRYDDAEKLIQHVLHDGGELHGVIHSAGVIDDAFILKKTPESFASVIKPKVHGTLNLDHATRDLALDFFVTFSSVTSILGNFGQSDYGYGNAFEDYYAHYREELVKQGQRRGKSLSINWPYWKDGGMRLSAKEEEVLTKTFGFIPLSSERGVQALIDGLRSELTQFAVLPAGDVRKIEQVLGIGVQQPGQPAVAAAATGQRADGVYRQIESYLQALFAKELKIPVERIDGATSFDQYGMDSIIMIDLITVMEEKFSSLPKTLLFEHRTLAELARYFEENYADHFSARPPSAPVEPLQRERDDAASDSVFANRFAALDRPADTVRSRAPGNDDEIAIIGLSGRYPQANNLDEFWQNLKAGRDCVTEVPADRWDLAQMHQPGKPAQGKSYGKWGGFLQDADKFDPLFFNISPGEAENMDPQERLFLETVAATIEDAGYTADALTTATAGSENPVGVFAGVMWGDYQLFGVESDDPARWVNPRSFYWAIANRVSYYFNFSGPSIAIDTACSSSLTALHLACDSLRKGECAVAVAGGVNLSLHPNKYNLLSNMQFLSSDGRCRSFGEGGDGYVPGEGVGAVLLKPLRQAVADGDHIYAVIKGSSINHGGKTSGFTVPNPKRQSQLIADALQVAGVNPRHISYLEAHGTGTALGDPIEMIGLNKAFAQSDRQYCAIGSLKSNIGHLEAAAGIAGLTKVLLQLQHRTLVPSLHADEINKNIDFAASPFYLQQQLQPWNRPVFVDEHGNAIEVPRIAGISSFGAGGSNAHVIVEEYMEPVSSEAADTKPTEPPCAILLSARKEESLQAYAQSLKAVCDSPAAMDLHDMAYTLQVGRAPLDYRLAIVCSDRTELSRKLDAYLNGQSDIDGLLTGSRSNPSAIARLFVNDSDSQEVVGKWMQKKNYASLASLWVNGAPVNWAELHRGTPRKRLSLPTYPFKKERYWITKPPETRGVSALHPLLDSNISSLQKIAFSKTLSGGDFYLRDHRLGQTRIMPAAAFVEMAVQAGKRACGGDVTVLKNVLWTRPLAIKDQPKNITIDLYSDADSVYFEVSDAGNDHRETYCQGRLETTAIHGARDDSAINVDAIKRKSKPLSGEALEKYFAGMGFQFGPTFRVFNELYCSAGEALAFITLPAELTAAADAFLLHPALIDGVLRTTVGVGGPEHYAGYMPLPVALQRMEIYAPVNVDCCVHASLSPENSADSQVRHFDITVMTHNGTVLARLRNFMTRLIATTATVAADTVAPRPNADKGAVDTGRLFGAVENYLKRIVSGTLKLPVEQIESQRPLDEYGIDSVMIASLNDMLEQAFGPLSKTLFFEYRDLAALAGYFVEEHAEKIATVLDANGAADMQRNLTVTEPAAPSSSLYDAIGFSPVDVASLIQPHNRKSTSKDDIAIVGISGRYPKAADLDEFHANLRAGRNCVSEIPADRWDGNRYYDADRKRLGKSYSKWGGFLDRIDQFDPLFFNVTPAEVVTIDPQERIFLETVWETLENAGYTKSSLSAATVGVFAGSMWGHYELLGVQEGGGINQKLPTSNFSSIANRVSYYFNFRGPSIALDTMCSSSLTAIHLACESIQRGECDVAIAGGVNLNLHPHKYLLLSGFQFLSTDGKCRSFGAGGDGYVPGEGAGAVMLKPLRQAEADGDFIYGVIKGTGINHGGKANGFYVPNPNAQGELIGRVLSQNQIRPEQLSYIEAHGTGTALGDPIEITGLKQALSCGERGGAHCSIGSVKSNIGHLEAAAGIAGITKILLQMNHQELFPSLHSATLNPNLDLDGAPFYVQQKLQPWSDGGTAARLAGINSFGAGGSNAFIVLQEYKKYPGVASKDALPQLVPISARTANALKQYAKRLAEFIARKAGQHSTNHGLPLALGDLAFTLQTGREQMQERLAIVASSLDELREKLEQFSQGQQSSDGVYAGSAHQADTAKAKKSNGNGANGSAHGDLHHYAQSWVSGAKIDFHLLPRSGQVRKIPLPNYCFQRKRYWFTRPDAGSQPVHAQPVHAQPVHAQPVHAQPVHTQPVHTQPVHAQAVHAQPAHTPAVHKQPGSRLPLIDHADSATGVFRKTLQASDPLVAAHRFEGRPLFPAVAYLEMVAEALQLSGQSGRVSFKNVVWQTPLFVSDSGTEIFLTLKQQANATGFEIWTLQNQQRTVHGKGLIAPAAVSPQQGDERADLQAYERHTFADIDRKPFYDQFGKLKISYGRDFQSIDHIRYGTHHVIARYELPGSLAGNHNYLQHPAVLDSALQAFMMLPSFNGSDDMQFPFAVDSVEMIKPLQHRGYALVSISGEQQHTARLVDDSGCICIKFDGVKFRQMRKPVSPAATTVDKDHLFAPVEHHVKTLFGRLLDIDHQDLKSDVTFDQYGLESVMAVNLANELEKDFGALPATLLFEYQTIDTLCGYLLDHYRDVCAAKFAPASAAVSGDDLHGRTTQYIKGVFSEFLQIDLDELNPQVTFENYGLESVMAVNIAARLERDFGSLPSTLLFEHQTIGSLADYLISERASDCESLLGRRSPETKSIDPLPITHGPDSIRMAINALSDTEVERLLAQLTENA
jgi:acyl transferase domain-containing protein/acyl carrier protein